MSKVSREEALELARKLERVVAILAAEASAEASPSEHFELRLAEALAGNLADQLAAVAMRGARVDPRKRKVA
jgi:hypothetical protein